MNFKLHHHRSLKIIESTEKEKKKEKKKPNQSEINHHLRLMNYALWYLHVFPPQDLLDIRKLKYLMRFDNALSLSPPPIHQTN